MATSAIREAVCSVDSEVYRVALVDKITGEVYATDKTLTLDEAHAGPVKRRFRTALLAPGHRLNK